MEHNSTMLISNNKEEIRSECIRILCDRSGAGFSYVQSFVDFLWEKRDKIGLTNAALLWKVQDNAGYSQEFSYFPNKPILLQGLDIEGMMEHDGVIDNQDSSAASFKGNGFWDGAHIMAIPISYTSTYGDEEREMRIDVNGLVLLIAKDGQLNISKVDWEMYYSIIKAQPPVVLNNPTIHEAEMMLVPTNSIPESDEVLKTIGQSLNTLSEKSKFPNQRLRHFSLWVLHRISLDAPYKADNMTATKVFSQNTYNGALQTEFSPLLSFKKHHFITDLVLDNYDYDSDAPYIIYLPFNEIAPRRNIKQLEYFETIGFTSENGTVISVVQRIKNEKDNLYYVACYYVSNLPHSFFLSRKMVASYSSQLFRLIVHNYILQNNQLLQQFLEYSGSAKSSDEFLSRTTKHLSDIYGAENYIFYYKKRDSWHYISARNLTFSSTAIFPLPEEYADDARFVAFTQKIVHLADTRHSNAYQETAYSYVMEEPTQGTLHSVKSAIAVLACLEENQEQCILLFVDKTHQSPGNGMFVNSMLTYDNSIVSRSCGMILLEYKRRHDLTEGKTELLRKFRHEIPSCTVHISRNLNLVIELTNKLHRLPPVLQQYGKEVVVVKNTLKMISVNNLRVHLLGKFFAAVDFKDEQFTENPEYYNMSHFMTSYIDMFREMCKYDGGIDVTFSFERNDSSISYYISNYMTLSFVNVITNAIRYAAPGTRVHILIGHDFLKVTDLGIPILNDEKEKIFQEGYRSQYARASNAEGMGYGLYLTRRIVEAHGGSIRVESNPVCKENYYVQHALCHYFKDLESKAEKDDFIYKDTFSSAERESVKSLRDKVFVADQYIDPAYVNLRKKIFTSWVEYKMKGSSFIDLANKYFFQPLHKVTFTINLKQ